MRKALFVSLGVVVLALAAWFLLAGDAKTDQSADQPVEPTVRAEKRSAFDDDDRFAAMGRGLTSGLSSARDGGWPEGFDGAVTRSDAGDDVAKLVQAFTDAQIKARLAQNAARAKEEVDRFCERNEKLKKTPLFEDKPGTRDAATFMASRVDWEGALNEPMRLGSLHLPDSLRQKGTGNWLVNITDADLQGMDLTWMKQLLAFDVWTFGGDGAAEDVRASAMSSPIPQFVVLFTWAKLRFARALRDGDWNQAFLEVRHLAYLVHTMRIAVAEIVAANLLRIEGKAREQAISLNVTPVDWPPLPDASFLEMQRETAVKSGWFVAPGVDREVRQRALECSALKCTIVLEGLSLHSSFRTWSAPGELEQFIESTQAMPCDPAMMKRLLRMPPATLQEVAWLLEAEDKPLLSPQDGGK